MDDIERQKLIVELIGVFKKQDAVRDRQFALRNLEHDLQTAAGDLRSKILEGAPPVSRYLVGPDTVVTVHNAEPRGGYIESQRVIDLTGVTRLAAAPEATEDDRDLFAAVTSETGEKVGRVL